MLETTLSVLHDLELWPGFPNLYKRVLLSSRMNKLLFVAYHTTVRWYCILGIIKRVFPAKNIAPKCSFIIAWQYWLDLDKPKNVFREFNFISIY